MPVRMIYVYYSELVSKSWKPLHDIPQEIKTVLPVVVVTEQSQANLANSVICASKSTQELHFTSKTSKLLPHRNNRCSTFKAKPSVSVEQCN